VYGLDLLAYRWSGDVPALVRAVVGAASGPIIAAGSVDSAERIQALTDAGAWAFTIGGAIFDQKLPAGPSVREQVECALALTAAAAGREVVADGA
jgi:phosphoribosylformimino-5-aminoimidazole carboxamide ribonucleotide (ProFAR) isomerase